MKNEDKKVPDVPDKLYVFPCHTGITCGLIDPDGKQYDGYHVWQGMAVKASADDVLYINISKVWHKGKELPKSNEEDCLLDYADGLTKEVGHTYTDPDENAAKRSPDCAQTLSAHSGHPYLLRIHFEPQHPVHSDF